MLNKIIKVLIADDDELFSSTIKKSIDTQPDMAVVGTAHNGNETLRLIEKTFPDMLLLDIVMPQKNGITVLEEIKKDKNTPDIIMLSSIEKNAIISHTLMLGAAFYMIKPIEIDGLLKIIRRINEGRLDESTKRFLNLRNYRVNKLNEQIAHLLMEIGIAANLKGYDYLRDGLTLVAQDNALTNCVTKILYPKIAKKYNTKPQNVERSIRHAIETSWKKGGGQKFINSFSGEINSSQPPTNSQFISLLTDYINKYIISEYR